MLLGRLAQVSAKVTHGSVLAARGQCFGNVAFAQQDRILRSASARRTVSAQAGIVSPSPFHEQ